MYTTLFDSDYHQQQQQAIAEDLRIDGQTDGYDGAMPKHPSVDYLQGYAAGARQRLQELTARLAERSLEPTWSNADDF